MLGNLYYHPNAEGTLLAPYIRKSGAPTAQVMIMWLTS